MTSSRIDEGIRVPFGSPYLEALSSSNLGTDGSPVLFDVVFFGIGEGDAFGAGDDGEAIGDDGEEFLRGMEAYTVLDVLGF
jgi:hypothetical protein